MNEQEIYNKALLYWGEASQRLMVIEECAELISSICKCFRGRVNNDDVMDEAVDVQVMINQLRDMLNNEDKWNKKMRYKLDRLEERIKKAQAEGEEHANRQDET